MTSRKIPESAVENLVSDLEGKANVSLSNLSAAGQAKFDAKANVSNTVTTNTAQTITGFKAFNNGSGNNRTNIDIITNDGVAEDANTKWAGSIQFKKGNLDVGFCEAMRDNKNSSIAQIVAHNSVNGQEVYASLRSVVTSDGTTFGTAPNTPDNAPANAIVTKDKIANMVTTNTNQTISGVKTFNANTIVKGSGAGNGTFTIKNDVTTYGTSAVDLVVATANGKNQFLVHFQEGNKWCTYFEQNPSTKDVALSMGGCAAVYAPTPAANANDTQVATTAWVRNLLTPTGTIIIWSAPNPPAGYLVCNGAAISRTTYAALFKVIGTTWGAGDGKTTFNLPNFNYKSVWQNPAAAVGTSMVGSLPNITASWTAQGTSQDSRRPVLYNGTGAINTGTYSSGGGLACVLTNTWDGQTAQNFNASRSSSIYQDGQTQVVPASNMVLFCIRY